VILGTNFSSLTNTASSQLQMLDNLQYQNCLKWQTAKSEFTKENLEAKMEQTLAEMVKLLNQSGSIPPATVKELVLSGVLDPDQARKDGIVVDPADDRIAPTPKNVDDVPVPILPVPAKWETVTFPCQAQAMSSAGVIRARGMESSMDPQIAKSIANVIALEELASKIEVTVKSTTQYFIDRTETNLNEELTKRFNRTIDVSVNQTIRGYRNTCEEYRQHSQTQKYQCFVALEINEDAVLKPLHEELKKDPELTKAVPDFSKFKDTFNEVLNFYEKTGIN
jgi:hypothetical protein